MIRNFLFHRVTPQKDLLWDPMRPELFEKVIRHITTKYSVVQFEEMMGSISLHSNKKAATIMFDDGYKDNIDFALPILQKYNVKASFYVVTDCISNNSPTWTHVLEYRFQNTQKKAIDLRFDFLPEELQVNTLNSNSEKLMYVSKLKPFLKKISSQNRKQVLDAVNYYFDDIKLPTLMMDWSDLRLLKEQGHFIGSHSQTHDMLGTIDDETIVFNDLKNSAEAIEKNLGHFPATISYPVGSYNEQVIRLSKKAGYKYGLAVKQTVFNSETDNFFEIPRIELYNESWFKTKLRISNKLETIKSLIHYR
ncbi:MAG TPA: hypothetical protein DEP77_09635 [Bacteroidales bacterium]|nr:hypothetical protein [Bacteroidales bacterium]